MWFSSLSINSIKLKKNLHYLYLTSWMNARIIKLCSSLFQNLSKRAYISVCIAGCMMSIALGRENIENQIKLAQTEAFNQLVRLLRTHKDSPQVILMVIQVLGILCVGQCNIMTELFTVDQKFNQVAPFLSLLHY